MESQQKSFTWDVWHLGQILNFMQNYFVFVTGHSNLVGMAGVMGIHRVTCDPLHPFNHPKEGPRARAFTPDNMEPDEIEAFPEYYKSVK